MEVVQQTYVWSVRVHVCVYEIESVRECVRETVNESEFRRKNVCMCV